MLDAVVDQSKVTQSKVLRAVLPMLSYQEQKSWPKSRNQIDVAITKTVGNFYARVTRRVRIDLHHIGLDGLRKPIEFVFIDPLFAWAACAEQLSHDYTLYFEHQSLRHPVTGEQMYGASVKNGTIMEEACKRVPTRSSVRTGPALLGLSWDAGNASRRRSYTPIVISVGNTDYSGLQACSCVAYLPELPLSSGEMSTPLGKQARHELVQACAAAIIDVIDECAQDGFLCTLNTGYVYIHVCVGCMYSLYVFTYDLDVCLHCMCSHTIWAYVFTVCVHI